MATIEPTVKDKGFQNWLKGALALLFTKQGLDDFVLTEMTQFQKDCLKFIYLRRKLTQHAKCFQCTTENVLPCPTPSFCSGGRSNCTTHDSLLASRTPNRHCPNNICQDIRDWIHQYHRFCKHHKFLGPSWKNSDASKWCEDPFEIAKCYLPLEGYICVETLAQTDFNGTVSIIYNNGNFQNKMDADLDQTPNICTQARAVGHEIRHTSDMSVSDEDLAAHIDKLTRLLSDTKCLAGDKNAQQAVDKLNQLKEQKLTITTENIIEVLEDQLKAIVTSKRDDALEAIDTEQNQVQRNILRNLKDDLHNMQTISMQNLDQIIARKLNEVKEAADKEKERLKEISAKEKEEIREEIRKEKSKASANVMNMNVVSSYDRNDLEKSMKEDLMDFYRKFQSTIPVSPIVEDQDVQLENFYVQPPLVSFDIKKTFGRVQDSSEKRAVYSYCELFNRTEGQHYKDIYITAKAGVGKTSLVKRMGMLWCQAHSPDQLNKFEPDDVKVMKTFDFLFMVTLRDSDPSLCRVDDLIFNQLIKNLSRSRRYDELLLEDILHEKICLIILDGLDEWSHPENCKIGSRSVHDLPHRPAREKCTILTTTRPWKLDFLTLGMKGIDRHVEITEMDKSSSRELVENAVKLLNSRSTSQTPKSSAEFLKASSSMILDSLRYIPYILLQMVCIWFDSESIGNSKCEIYSNILELTLSRGSKKTGKRGKVSMHAHSGENAKSIPLCLRANAQCIAHYDLLLQLGQVAFETLFCSKKEATIVFDESAVTSIIPDYSVSFCLEMGLLTQTRDYRKVSSRRKTFSFQHKSVQEFMAALYIQANIDSDDVRHKLFQACNTLAGVLEMSNTLVFVGGFSPEACRQIFQILQDVLSNDDTVQYYRNNLLIKEYGLSQFWRVRESIRGYQYVHTDILQEMSNSSNKLIPLDIEDVVVDRTRVPDSFQYFKTLVQSNRTNIKSLDIRDFSSTDEFTELLDATGIRELGSLEKLIIVAVPRLQDLENFLSKSLSSLKCLRVSFFEFRRNLYYAVDTYLSIELVRTLSDVENLVAIMFNNIRLSHDSVRKLFETVCGRQRMKEIGLYNVRCIDHGFHCRGEMLDLSRHQCVRTLNLDNLPVTELRVNPNSLEECLIGEDTTSVFPAWFDHLNDARKLHALWFRKMDSPLIDDFSDKVSKLTQLKKLGIEITEFGDTALILSPDTHIESVYLYKVTITTKTLGRFAESLLSLAHPVRVTLEWCNVTPERETQKFKDYIASSSRFKLYFNGLNFRDLYQFEFETVPETTTRQQNL